MLFWSCENVISITTFSIVPPIGLARTGPSPALAGSIPRPSGALEASNVKYSKSLISSKFSRTSVPRLSAPRLFAPKGRGQCLLGHLDCLLGVRLSSDRLPSVR